MARTVQYDAEHVALRIGKHLRESDGAGSFVAHLSDLPGLRTIDLRDALRTARHDEGPDRLEVSDVDLGYFDEEDSPVTQVSFSLDDEGHVCIDILFVTEHWEDDDALATAYVRRILAPLLQRHRLSLLRAHPHQNYVNPPWPWQAQLPVLARGTDLTDLYDAGLEAIALMEAAAGGQLTRLTAGDLLRAGQAQVLLGQPEGDWLDAKTQHYDLSHLGGKVALCQAIARFANAEYGGLVVVGMRTKKVPGGEVIRSLTPVPLEPAMVRKYQHVLEHHLYPPPDFLRIDAVPVTGGMLLVIDIPPQPEEHKPFLVHGAIVDGRHEGAFISVVRRRGESSIPITAAALHSTLSAGRALLRYGGLTGVTSAPGATSAAAPEEPAGATRRC